MSQIVSQYLYQIILALFLAAAAFLGAQVRNLYRKFVTTEIKQSVCRTAVRFVEQVYIDIHGPEKLRQAMTKASELLQEKGITITETELVALIEAAVNEFNNAFAKNIAGGQHLPGTPKEDTTAAETSAAEPEAETEGPSVSEIIADMKDIY